MNTIQFQEKESVTTVTVEQLRQTSGLSDFAGKLPKTRPVEHYKLIEDLTEILVKNNLTPKPDPIYVSKSDSKRIMALDPEKQGVLPSWLFQRLVARIGVEQLGDEKSHTSIAIAYNTNGMSVAWGQNVRVCQNMNIFGSTMMYTYGSGTDRVQEYEKLLQVFNQWCLGAEQKRAFDLEIYRKMNEITFTQPQVKEFIGECHLDAVKTAYVNSAIKAPLNIGQLSEYSRTYLKEFENNDLVTLHDLYQVGTAILKPTKTDIVTIWDDIKTWGNNLIQKFNLN